MELNHSNKLIEQSVKQIELSPAERIVLAIICSHAKKTSKGWTCFPSMATLATECGMSEETVRKHRRRLESLGYISKEIKAIEGKPKHKRHIYTIIVSALGFTVDAIKARVKKSKQFVFNMASLGKKKDKRNTKSDFTLSDLDIAKNALITNKANRTQLELLHNNVNILSAVERHQLKLAGIGL